MIPALAALANWLDLKQIGSNRLRSPRRPKVTIEFENAEDLANATYALERDLLTGTTPCWQSDKTVILGFEFQMKLRPVCPCCKRPN